MLACMSDQPVESRVHPAAVGGAVLAVVALLMAMTGFEWAWVLGIAAVGVSAATRTPGVWSRVLGLFGVVGGLASVVISFA